MESLELDFADLDNILRDQSYVCGYEPTQGDVAVWQTLGGAPSPEYPHISRWYMHIASFGADRKSFQSAPLSVVIRTGNTNGNKKMKEVEKVKPLSTKPQKVASNKSEAEVRALLLLLITFLLSDGLVSSFG